MLISLLVPEGVVICAFGQWREARRILKKQKDSDANVNAFKEDLGMEGALFVVMGGFVVECELPDAVPRGATTPLTSLIGNRRTIFTGSCKVDQGRDVYMATLTSTGFLKYLDEGYIKKETFKKEDISDKGKSSAIAKTLSTMQAAWLLIQCVARWRSGLPVTLLEYHAAIQVICTLAIVAFWWNKPLDVNEPIVIKLQIPDKIPPIKIIQDWVRPEDPSLDWSRKNSNLEPYQNFSHRVNGGRWSGLPMHGGGLIAVTAKACSDILLYAGEGGRLTMVAEGILVFLIGVFHALAWSFHFPSGVERWLWRGSSLAMSGVPLVVVSIALFTNYQKDLARVIWKMQLGGRELPTLLRDSFLEIHYVCVLHACTCSRVNPPGSGCWKGHIVRYMFHLIFVWTCLLSIGAYAYAVIFILFVSYSSIRDLPEGSFYTPRWADYWPHL